MERPALFTFDIFGTVIDWRRGLRDAVARYGVSLTDADFDRVIDAQGEEEAGDFRAYAEIVASSLVSVLGLAPEAAVEVGAAVGTWPPYPDSEAAMRRLMRISPCVAMTNSDRAHGEQTQAQLGFRLSDWICAEETRVYKPSPRFWRAVAERLGVIPGPHWWHVSAYADYDLATARTLGLTCVYVARPHSRPGPSDLEVVDLGALAERFGPLP